MFVFFRLGPFSHSCSSNWGSTVRRRSSATQPKLLYRLGKRGVSLTAAALSLEERRGGIESEPKLELGSSACDDQAVEGGDAVSVTRVVLLVVEVDLFLGVVVELWLLIAVLVVLMSRSTVRLILAAATAAGPLGARMVDVVVVLGKME